MLKMERINLGNKPVNKITMFFGLIMYYLLRTKGSKNLDEFKSGMINHKCEYDYDNIKHDEEGSYSCSCKHYGCNFSTLQYEDGSWIPPFYKRISKANKDYKVNVL